MTEIRMCNRCRSNVLNENDLKACTRCKDIFKQKRLNNIDEIKLQAKEYYKEHREDRIKQSSKWQAENIDKLRTQIECACGMKFQHRHKSQHTKTQKHQKYILSLTIV